MPRWLLQVILFAAAVLSLTRVVTVAQEAFANSWTTGTVLEVAGLLLCFASCVFLLGFFAYWKLKGLGELWKRIEIYERMAWLASKKKF